jgi:diguanylate cyclase (GGDEF)-like protein/PAS domain S-box-containing protein
MARILLTMILVYWLGSLTVLALSLTWGNELLAIFLILGCILQILPLYFLLRGDLTASNSMTVGIYILFATLFATFGQGIHDYVVMAYPAAIMFSGLTARWRGLLASTLLTLIALAWLVFGEANGWYVIYPIRTPNWADLITAWILIVIAAVAVYLLVSNLQAGLTQTKRELDERLRAEEALKNSQTRLQALTDATKQSFVLMDKDANILSFNRIAARNARVAFGSDMQEGDSMFKFILEQERAQFTEYFDRALRGEIVTVEQISPSFVWQDHWVSFTYNPAHAENGDIIGVCLNSIDVTEKKHAEEALQNSERRLQALIENGLDYISLLDAEGNLLWESPSSTNILDYRLNEFLGKSIFEIMHPDDLEWISPQFAEVAGVPGDRRSGIFRLRRSDGSWRWIEAVVTNFLHDPAVEALVINYRDITERKHAADALHQSEQRFRTLVNSMEDIVYTLDRDQRYTGVYGQWIEKLELTPEFFMGKTMRDVWGRQAGHVHEIVNAQALAGETVVYEWTLSGVTKETRYYQTSLSPLKDFEGSIIGIAGLGRDITEQKRHEALLSMRLELLELAVAYSADEIMQKALDQICLFTDSSIGFYHFVEPDQKTLSLQAWSTRTLDEFCKAEGKGMHYDIDQAGIWVDCIRQRKPVIHNDYASLSDRKGLPSGHAEVIRELVVPVYRGGIVVSILGIGNKPVDYTERDIDAVSYIADVIWEIVKRKQTEQSLRDIQSRLHLLGNNLEEAALYVYSHDLDGRMHFEYLSASMEKLTGVKMEDAIQNAASIHSLILPEYLPRVVEMESKSKEDLASFSMEVRQRHAISGEIHWALLRSTPRRRPDGSTVWYGVQLDITERKKVEESEREQRALAEALSNSAAALNTTLNFDEVMDRVLDNVGRVVPHDAANIMLLDKDGDTLSIAYTRNYMEHDVRYDAALRLSLTKMPILAEAARDGRTMLITDTHANPAWLDIPAIRWVCSYLTVPIRIRQHTVGFLNLDSATPGFFNSHHAERLQAFANHAAIAIENARLYEEVQKLAVTDTVTGIFNRTFFETEMARMESSRDFPVSIIIADLDNMKKTNDTLGHAAGDELLNRTVQVLQSAFRAADILARIGGDEFAVLLPNTNEAKAQQALSRIREKMAEYNAAHPDFPVHVSLGAATAEQNSLAEIFIIADQRMYADKAMRKSNNASTSLTG